MGIPNIFNTGRTGMVAAKVNMATTGHNIANANTEGYSRQRVQQETSVPNAGPGSRTQIGTGVAISRVERINDGYLEKQIRHAGRDMAAFEEKEMVLKQTEDIFNEMGGEGINRLMSRFFNEFRQLGNDPDNEAIRQSVRESTQALVNDFHRIRKNVEEVREHIDSRIESHTREINGISEEIRSLNQKIATAELGGGAPNDLLDKRDLALKKLGTFMDVTMHKDGNGNYNVDIRGVGPMITGAHTERFSVRRTSADDEGKPENALDIHSSSSANGKITHALKGGKLGALVEARDQMLSTVLERLDDLAFSVATAVNEIHRQGFTRNGATGVDYFRPLVQRERASEFIQLSEAVRDNANNIAAAAIPDAPGDNRIAHAISNIQNLRMMNEGRSSIDDFYNSIVADVGVATQRNRANMNQTKDIQTQLGKMRDQISGVSIDEETANLLQFQHAFDASAKLIQIADECLDTVMSIKR